MNPDDHQSASSSHSQDSADKGEGGEVVTKPAWAPLTSRQRRVLGVLIEKARTTPDAYPMTLNAVTVGCNQKSNRAPHMELKADEVETILDELRRMGAVAEVQTGGRVPKYRHYAYDWFGVKPKELAILTELMLRGEQTLGDLRARASRMEPIRDQNELRELIDGLVANGLMIELSPPGRGQIVSHGLYTDRERERLSTEGHVSVPSSQAPRSAPNTPETEHASRHEVSSSEAPPSRVGSPQPAGREEADEVIANLQAQVEALSEQVSELSNRLEQAEETLRSLLS